MVVALEDVARVADAVAADAADVDEAFAARLHALELHEGSVVHDALHDSVVDGVDLEGEGSVTGV